MTTSNWWRFYGFGQIYSPKTIGSGIGVAWTLCIEVTFYIALPVFAFLAARASRRGDSVRADVVLLVALLSLASLAYPRPLQLVLRAPEGVERCPGRSSGSRSGWVLPWPASGSSGCRGGAPRWWPVLSWAIAIGLWLLLHEIEAHPGTLGWTASTLAIHVLYGLAAFFLLLPAVFGDREGGSVRRVLSLRWLAWVGLVSYAFYLYHTIVIAQLDKLAHNAHIALRYPFVAVGSLVVSLVCAAASYYLLERPIMRLGRRRRTGARA